MAYENITRLVEMLNLFNSGNRMMTYKEINMLDDLLTDARADLESLRRANKIQNEAINKFYARRND